MPYRWREPVRECVEQVANGPDSGLDLTPASEAPAQAVRDGWAPLLTGQAIPKLGERVYDPLEDDLRRCGERHIGYP